MRGSEWRLAAWMSEVVHWWSLLGTRRHVVYVGMIRMKIGRQSRGTVHLVMTAMISVHELGSIHKARFHHLDTRSLR